MTEQSVSTAADFKKKQAPITLPSGQNVRMRRTSLQAFMTTGIIPNKLMEVAQKAISKGKDPEMSELAGIITDEGQLTDMIRMMDDAVVHVMIEPKVLPLPEEGEERDPDQLYIDEIDDEDKMFIFNWAVGGTADVEQFRGEATSSLASLAGGKTVAAPAKRAARTR